MPSHEPRYERSHLIWPCLVLLVVGCCPPRPPSHPDEEVIAEAFFKVPSKMATHDPARVSVGLEPIAGWSFDFYDEGTTCDYKRGSDEKHPDLWVDARGSVHLWGEYELIHYGSAGQLYVQVDKFSPPIILVDTQKVSPAFRRAHPSLPVHNESATPADVLAVKREMAAWQRAHGP